MRNLSESETDERKIFARLDGELDEMIARLAGTEMDCDPAIEVASLEATKNSAD